MAEFIALEDGTIKEPHYREEAAEKLRSAVRKRTYQDISRKLPERATTTTVRSATVANQIKPPFAVSPSKIVFKDFEVGKTYEIKLKFTNTTRKFENFRIAAISPKYSDIFEVKYTLPQPISAGLSWPVTVIFTPTRNEDVNTELVVKTANGNFTVPLSATTKKTVIRMDTQIVDFGSIVVGDKAQKQLVIRNDGAKEGSVSISGSFKKEIEKLHTDPVTQSKGPFLTVMPQVFRLTLPPFSEKAVDFFFNPMEETDLDCNIIFSPGDSAPDAVVRIKGRATSLPVHVCSGDVDFQWCFYGNEYCREITLNNTSNVTAVVGPRLPRELQGIVHFDPETIVVQSQSKFSMMMYFKPDNSLGDEFDTDLHLFVKGQTLPALLSVKAKLTERRPQLSCTAINYGTQFMNVEKEEEVVVTNQSALPQVMGFMDLPENIRVVPQCVRALPKESVTMKVHVHPPYAGVVSQSIYLVNEFGDSERLIVAGCGEEPILKFSEPYIVLTPCNIGASVTASTILHNTSKQTRQFLFRVSDPCISVSPSRGTIPPNQNVLIVLFFTPPPEFVDKPVTTDPNHSVSKLSKKRLSSKSSFSLKEEPPKVNCYANWKTPSQTETWWRQNKISIMCICDGESRQETYAVVKCTVTKAEIVGRSLLSSEPSADAKRKSTKPKKGTSASTAASLEKTAPVEVVVSERSCSLVVDFGDVSLTHKNFKTCFVTNFSDVPAPLRLRAINPLSPFSVVRLPMGDLQPNQEESVVLQFKPTEYGNYMDVIKLYFNERNTVEITVQGTCCNTELSITTAEQNNTATNGASDANSAERSAVQSVSSLTFEPTLVGDSTTKMLFFHNMGSFPIEISMEPSGGNSDWRSRRTFIFQPSIFNIKPGSKASVTAIFSPQQDDQFKEAVTVRAGGNKSTITLFGRGCATKIYFVKPGHDVEHLITDYQRIDHLPTFAGTAPNYPIQLRFARGETKKLTFGGTRECSNGECIVEKWDEAFTAAGWSIDPVRFPITQSSSVVVSISLDRQNTSSESFLPYCSFQITVKCPSDSSCECTYYICCTSTAA